MRNSRQKLHNCNSKLFSFRDINRKQTWYLDKQIFHVTESEEGGKNGATPETEMREIFILKIKKKGLPTAN